MIESASELLYGLIHARFILTSRGMAVMVRRRFSAFSSTPRHSARVLSSSHALFFAGRSWRSFSTSTSGAARACTAKGSRACQWASRTSRGNGRSRSSVRSATISTSPSRADT